MKSSLRLANSVACVLAMCLSITVAHAQVGGRTAVPGGQMGDRIAVIDINYIFKNHVRFKGMVDDWKKDVKAVEDQMRTRGNEVQKKMKQLEQFKPGTPDYKQLEEGIARLQSEFKVEVQLQKKDLMEREAKMYFNVYQEIQNVVAYFAQRMNITLVLRYSRDPINSEDPRAIQQALLRPVVHVQKNVDITMDILQRLNGGQKIGQKPVPINTRPRRN